MRLKRRLSGECRFIRNMNEELGHESSSLTSLVGTLHRGHNRFAAFSASAQTTPMTGGEMKGENMMKGCDMMGGDMTRMTQMMSMMHEKLSHAGYRVEGRSRPISRSPRCKCRHGINSPMRSSRRRHAQADDAVWQHSEPSPEARIWAPCQSAGD